MLKHDIIQLIRENYSQFYKYYRNIEDDKFGKPQLHGKWSPGQHLEHIRISTKVMNKAMQIPRLILWYKFGKTERVEKSYDQLKNKYLTATNNGFKAPPKFEPREIFSVEKYKLITRVRTEEQKLIAQVSACEESFLSKYQLPHPVFGKLTIREMLLFVAFHTEHHRKTLLKYNQM